MSPGSMPGWINPSASACFSPSSNVTTLSRTLTCPSGATPPAPGGGYENCSFFVQAVPYGVATSQIDVSPAFVTVPAGDSATVNFTLTALGTVPPLRQDFDLIAWQRNTRSTNPERVNLNAKLNVVADHNRHLCI